LGRRGKPGGVTQKVRQKNISSTLLAARRTGLKPDIDVNYLRKGVGKIGQNTTEGPSRHPTGQEAPKCFFPRYETKGKLALPVF